MATYKDTLLLVDKVTGPLKKIQENIQKSTKEMNKFRTTIKKLNSDLLSLAPASLKALNAVKKLTTGFIGLVGASGAITMGIKAATTYSDRIDDMSQKIGMSQKAFQEWDYIMSQNGGNVESLQMGFKTLTTQIEGVQKGSKDSVKAFRSLGVSIYGNNKKLKSQDEIFNDVIRKLQKIQNPTKKAMLANRLFGRSAAELRPLLNQEADAIDNLRKRANELGLIMSQKDIENATKFADTMETLGKFLQVRVNASLSQILPKLTKIFEDLMSYREPIDNIIRTLGKVVEVTFSWSLELLKNKELIYSCATAMTVFAGIAAWGQITKAWVSIKKLIETVDVLLWAGNGFQKFFLWAGAIWGAVQAARALWQLIQLIAAKLDKGKIGSNLNLSSDKVLGYLSQQREEMGAKAFNKMYDRSAQKAVENYNKTHNISNNTTNMTNSHNTTTTHVTNNYMSSRMPMSPVYST